MIQFISSLRSCFDKGDCKEWTYDLVPPSYGYENHQHAFSTAAALPTRSKMMYQYKLELVALWVRILYWSAFGSDWHDPMNSILPDSQYRGMVRTRRLDTFSKQHFCTPGYTPSRVDSAMQLLPIRYDTQSAMIFVVPSPLLSFFSLLHLGELSDNLCNYCIVC